MTHEEFNELKAALQRAQKEFESGRSMVEMLGVLAVIGVLSVAGVAGFRGAMNKHYSNEILSEVSRRAITVVAQMAQGGEANQVSFTDSIDKVGGAEFGSPAVKVGLVQFGIPVSKVSGPVCKNLVNMGVPVAKPSALSTKIQASACEDTNDLVFVFNNDGSTEAINTRKICGQYGQYKNGVCECVNGYSGEKCDVMPDLSGCKEEDASVNHWEGMDIYGSFNGLNVQWDGVKCVPWTRCDGGGMENGDGTCTCDACYYGQSCQYRYDECSA